MGRGVRIPKEVGDKLSEKSGLAPGGLKRIQISVDTEAGEPSLEDIVRALKAEEAEIEVLKHFEFASLVALAGMTLCQRKWTKRKQREFLMKRQLVLPWFSLQGSRKGQRDVIC